MELVFICIGAIFIAGVYSYCERFCDDEKLPKQRWFLAWCFKGLVVPLLLWFLINANLFPGLSPMLPRAAFALQGGGSVWRGIALVVTALFPILASYWAAISAGWWLKTALQHASDEDRRQIKSVLLLWSPLLLLSGFLLYRSGMPSAGFAALIWLFPVTRNIHRIGMKKVHVPVYNTALARMAYGKYDEAEMEIINELEKCEDDFEGWMLLAELYATSFNDVTVAHQTISDLIEQPNISPSQFGVAMHKLADWHLKVNADPEMARLVLQRIEKKYPGSHLAHMAQLRIKSLPASHEEMVRPRKALRLPSQKRKEDERKAAAYRPPGREEAKVLIEKCVENLKKNPNDVPERETLARLLADSLEKVDEASEQLELLIDMPGQPPAKTAEWLYLLATWKIKFRQDVKAAKPILERIVREFKDTPHGLEAHKRLSLINVEEKFRRAREATSQP